MTRYNPIADCAEDGVTSITAEDLRGQGYDTVEPAGGTATAAMMHVAAALNALGDDDEARWQVANQLVAAVEALERASRGRTSIELETRTRTVDPAEEWGAPGDPFEVEEDVVTVTQRRG